MLARVHIRRTLWNRACWLLVSDKRSIFVPLSGHAVDSLAQARATVGPLRGHAPGTPFDLVAAVAELEASVSIPHASLEKLTLHRLGIIYTFSYSFREGEDQTFLRGQLVPPQSLAKGKFAGTKAVELMYDYAMMFQRLYLQGLPPDLQGRAKWEV